MQVALTPKSTSSYETASICLGETLSKTSLTLLLDIRSTTPSAIKISDKIKYTGRTKCGDKIGVKVATCCCRIL